MKKIFIVFITALLALTLIVVPCFAEEATEDETPAIETEKGENIPSSTPSEVEGNTENTSEAQMSAQEDDNAAWVEELVTEITSVANWGKIGVVLSAIVALIVALHKIISPVVSIVKALKDEKATKEDVNASVNLIKKQFATEFEKANSETLAQFEAMKDKEDKLLAILTILATSLKINPTAKAEIMNYLTGITAVSGDAADVVATVSEKIEKALEAETPVETPALDAISAQVEEEKKAEAAHVALG